MEAISKCRQLSIPRILFCLSFLYWQRNTNRALACEWDKMEAKFLKDLAVKPSNSNLGPNFHLLKRRHRMLLATSCSNGKCSMQFARLEREILSRLRLCLSNLPITSGLSLGSRSIAVLHALSFSGDGANIPIHSSQLGGKFALANESHNTSSLHF